VLIFSASCRKQPRAELLRLLDGFSEENLVSSPLIGLLDHFELVNEDISGQWQKLQTQSEQDIETWAAVAAHRILGYEESRRPEGMALFEDGNELDFAPYGSPERVSWKWRRGILTLPAIELKNYKRKQKCSVINLPRPVEFSQVLPAGEVVFKVTVKKARADTPRSRLELYLDDTLIQTQEVSSTDYTEIVLTAAVDTGEYAVRLATSKGVLHVKKVVVQSASDLILLSYPGAEEVDPNVAKFRLTYPVQVLKASSHAPYGREYLVSLLEEDAVSPIPDLGVAAGLDQIKKKLVLEDVALNTLLAPPPSKFRFSLEVPEKAVLEFGYGIWENSWDIEAGEVEFTVLAAGDTKNEVLFSDTLYPAEIEAHQGLKHKKVDMTGFAGEKVDLQFVSQLASEESQGTPERAPFSFWHNPVVYSKKPERTDPGEDFNVILISLDTLRWDRLGCYGYERQVSPHIDELAEDCVLFSHCFVQSNWTLPSHVSMLTSLNSRRHQVYLAHEKMSASLLTVADILRVHGYYNGGITGGGYVSEKFGFSKGFDSYKGERYVFHAENEAEELGRTTVEWLDRNADKKFFLFLHTYQIHDPYYNHPGITDEFVEGEVSWQSMPIASFLRNQEEKRKYEFTPKEQQDIVALYDGEIKYTDRFLIAPLLQKLKELDLYENTLIILTSDHGEEFLDHGSWLHAHTLYNELIKVPLLIKYPESEHRGKRIETIVRSIDIVPTILEAAGIDAAAFDFDGLSLQPVVRGKENDHRVFFSDFSHKGSSDLRPTMVCTNQDFFKLILNRKPSPPRSFLFDLAGDGQEQTNLETEEADRLRRMFQSILDYYDNFKEIPLKSDQVIMDKALEERLKALGYIR
jgi:arylsulfatase A-like enzyme